MRGEGTARRESGGTRQLRDEVEVDGMAETERANVAKVRIDLCVFSGCKTEGYPLIIWYGCKTEGYPL
jgi:hypothetical protein